MYFSLKCFCINEDGKINALIGARKKKSPELKSTTPSSLLEIADISSIGAHEKKDKFD